MGFPGERKVLTSNEGASGKGAGDDAEADKPAAPPAAVWDTVDRPLFQGQRQAEYILPLRDTGSARDRFTGPDGNPVGLGGVTLDSPPADFMSATRSKALDKIGVTTAADLAYWQGPAPEKWQGEFADDVVRARAALCGVPLVRRAETVRVQRAEVEVDVDAEFKPRQGAYLWGAGLHEQGTHYADGYGEYHSFVTWESLPEPSDDWAANSAPDEGRAFGEFWTWMMDVRERAHAEGKTFTAYCYSRSAEETWLKNSADRFAGMTGASDDGRSWVVPSGKEVLDFLNVRYGGRAEWIDLFENVKGDFIGTRGNGLKKVAPAAGFAWRDTDPSGRASMGWHDRAVRPDPQLLPEWAEHNQRDNRDRLLKYNEDDVRATLRLRQYIDGGCTDLPTRAVMLADGWETIRWAPAGAQ